MRCLRSQRELTRYSTRHFRRLEAVPERRVRTGEKLVELRVTFAKYSDLYAEWEACVYCVGSLGRTDIGMNSDLDLFLLRQHSALRSWRVDDVEMIATAISINRELGYGPFSNDGQLLKVYSSGVRGRSTQPPDTAWGTS